MKGVIFILVITIFSACNPGVGNSKLTEIPGIDTVNSNDISKPVSKPALSHEIDRKAIDKLKGKFRIKKDEFAGTEWYKPKSAPSYVNYNAFYCYFQVNGGQASNLRLVIQYASDEWLFIRDCQFLVDGANFNLIPENMKRDNGSDGIWEWSDMQVNEETMTLLKAISTAKIAKVKFIGSDYEKIKSITSQQIKSIKESLDLYNALGGTL